MKVALTSCREHSTRLPGKNMLDLCGKPLICHTLDQMVECGDFFDLRLIATNWKEVLELVKDKYPTITPIELPKELTTPETPAQDYITYALEPYHQEGNEYCLLQSTSPLRHIGLIFDSYTYFLPSYNSLFTVNKYIYETDGQIYWFRDYKSIHKAPSIPYFCDPTVDVDYEYQLRLAEYILKRLEDE